MKKNFSQSFLQSSKPHAVVAIVGYVLNLDPRTLIGWLDRYSLFSVSIACVYCLSLYTSASEGEKRYYQEVFRHYVHLDLPDRFKSCSACSILTVTLRTLVICSGPEVLQRFIAYLSWTGELLWNLLSSEYPVSASNQSRSWTNLDGFLSVHKSRKFNPMHS